MHELQKKVSTLDPFICALEVQVNIFHKINIIYFLKK